MTFAPRAIGVIIGILLIVSPVFGEVIATETINLDIDDSVTDSNVYELVGELETVEEFPKYLVVRNVEELRAPFTLVISGKIKTNSLGDGIYECSTPIEIGGQAIYGHGTMGYQKYSDGTGYIWLDIESFNYEGSGDKYFGIYRPGSTAYGVADLYNVRVVADPYCVTSFPTDVPIAFEGGRGREYAIAGEYTYNIHKEFRHNITVTSSPSIDESWIDNITVARVVDGKPYQSTVEIAAKSGVYHQSTSVNEPISVIISSLERPYQINVYGHATELWYNKTVLSGPETPTDPDDPSRVMVHIIAQDARNENLLLDAAVEVRDQYDAVVAAGTTSPEGWMVFEYDLPDTLTDEDFDRYYTVSVSLPGWTQKVTNFKFYPAFIPRSGDWIRVEMLPDTDGPADPEKTYIMFFVRDIHANPLERASIEIAGQYWHTNSAGHVAVEVPKNSTTAYTVRKTGHVSISGSAAVGAEGSYVVNIALGPALPDRTPGPGDDPGATPPPRDTRTNEEKGKAVIDLIADNAELIATLAILAAVMGLINLIMPGRRRR